MNLEEWRAGGRFFEFDGHRVFYRREGSGEPIVCLHGFPAASFDYRKIHGGLTARFEFAAPDLIGYGFSDKPADFGYTTFRQADLVEAFVTHLGLRRVHILAHDYGNTITQELLARSEEGRLGFGIDSIVFLNGALFPETHRPVLAQKLLISPFGRVFAALLTDRRFKRSLAAVFGPGTQPTESELDDFVTLFRHNGGNRIAHLLIRYMAERAVYRDRWVPPLTRIGRPFRFINGLADPVSGRHLVDRFREVVPNERDIVELGEIGHFPHLEAPEITLDAILGLERTRPLG